MSDLTGHPTHGIGWSREQTTLAELEGFVYSDPAVLILAPIAQEPFHVRSGFKLRDTHFERVYEVSDATGLYQVARLAQACIQCEKFLEASCGMFLGSPEESSPQEEPVAVLVKLDFGHVVLRRYKKRGQNFVRLLFVFRFDPEWTPTSLMFESGLAAPPESVIAFGKQLLTECQEAEAIWE